jgi:predicted nucleotidyltransferase
MRLTDRQVAAIRQSVRDIVGESTRIAVFGSRLHDDGRGGDLDLLLEDDGPITLLQRARLKLALEAGLSLPVDVVTIRRGESLTPFQTLVRGKAVLL